MCPGHFCDVSVGRVFAILCVLNSILDIAVKSVIFQIFTIVYSTQMIMAVQLEHCSKTLLHNCWKMLQFFSLQNKCFLC